MLHLVLMTLTFMFMTLPLHLVGGNHSSHSDRDTTAIIHKSARHKHEGQSGVKPKSGTFTVILYMYLCKLMSFSRKIALFSIADFSLPSSVFYSFFFFLLMASWVKEEETGKSRGEERTGEGRHEAIN